MARKSFSHYEQLQILAEQDYKCRQCSTRFSKNVNPQFDHIDGDNSNNHIENGQAICANCHDVKSRKENAKRSHEKKDFDFVKYCPLCKNETKLSDYDFSDMELSAADRKLIEKSKHMPADQEYKCSDCKSELNVLRVDAKIKRKSNRKKLEKVVKYCACCGVEFELMSSNLNIQCGKCKSEFTVWIKKYEKKSGWFS